MTINTPKADKLTRACVITCWIVSLTYWGWVGVTEPMVGRSLSGRAFALRAEPSCTVSGHSACNPYRKGESQ